MWFIYVAEVKYLKEYVSHIKFKRNINNKIIKTEKYS